MDWTCPVCKQPNIGSDKHCINCGCPSGATTRQIASLSEQYSGASFPERDDDFAIVDAGSALFSHAWWTEKVSRFDGAILIFAIYFVFGALLGLIGAFRTASSDVALSFLGSGVLTGVGFTFRFLAMGANDEKRLARKRLVLEHSFICFASCLVLALRFG